MFTIVYTSIILSINQSINQNVDLYSVRRLSQVKALACSEGIWTKGHTDKRPQLPIYASIALLINVI